MHKTSALTLTFKLVSFLVLTGLLLSGLSGYRVSSAQAQGLRPSGPAPQVIKSRAPSLSQPLRSLASENNGVPANGSDFNPQDALPFPKAISGGNGGPTDPSIVQSSPIGVSMPSPIANFAGLNGPTAGGYVPPDTEGDIGFDPATGKEYFFQFVNVKFQVWDVTNPSAPLSVLGPLYGNTIWSGYGGLCDTSNGGDPVVLYDHLANRWFVSQLAYSGFGAPPYDYEACLAVSTSGDPTGTWWRYAFTWGSGVATLFNDYPKFGVWPDGYYMTVNEFAYPGGAWAGAGVAAFDRNAMLNGNPALMVRFNLGAVNINFGGMLPSDLNGPPPPPGTPNYFAEWDDSTWLGDAADTIRIWQFHVDWTTPANSTFGLSGLPNQLISTSNVDPNMCNYQRNCILQPGSGSPTFYPGLDAISDRTMYRLQYRNSGTYETLVSNHTVDTNGADKAGVDWFELRKTTGSWALNQEGVYSPDSDSRWMGSVAMDTVSNLALGYSVSSLATFPSVRYAGRLVTDALGTLPQGEISLAAGSGNQTTNLSRWGDYSTMSVDPADDCTFWYTQEYYTSTSSRDWATRIGSFSFPNCKRTVGLISPPDGTQACLRPSIGVTLLLSDLTRDSFGNFAPVTIGFTLDGSDILPAASITQTTSLPATAASLQYVPPSNLALGSHQVTLIYPAPGGTQSRSWYFTAADIACALGAAPAPSIVDPLIVPLPPSAPVHPYNPKAPNLPISH